MRIENYERLFARDVELVNDENLNRLIRWAEQRVAGLYLAAVDAGSNPADNLTLKQETDKYRAYLDENDRRCSTSAEKAG